MPPSASAGIGDRIVLCDPGRAFARCGCPAPDSPPRFLAAIGNVWGQAACQLSSTLFPFHRCSPGYLDHPNPALRDETYTLRAVRFSRRQLALLRTRAVALWAQRGSAARRHVFVIAVLGTTAGYLVWFLLPLGAGHHDLAIFALVTIETVLSIVYRNFLSRPWTSGGIDRAKNG